MTTVTVGASTHPVKTDNRQRSELIDEMTEYIGGSGKPNAKNRASRSLNRAIRLYNSVTWKFNRVEQDVTLAASTSEYTLNANFRAPSRAQYVDASDRTRDVCLWLNPEEYQTFIVEGTATSTLPRSYTAFNRYNEGKIRLIPNLSGTPKYPTLRLSYFKYISMGQGAKDILCVPADVEEAILDWAVYDLVKKERGSREARAYRDDAVALRQLAEDNWRGWPDIAWLGVSEVS